MDENYFNGSDNTGSSIGNGVPNPNNFGEINGQAPTASNSAVDAAQYAELESLVGRQGQELGEFRKFFSDIAPLLDKLDNSPEIVQAIIDGNITTDLAKAAIEGNVSISDAQIVTQAQKEVRQELGKEGFKNSSAEDVTRLIENKAREIKNDFQKELKERDDLSAFESSVNDFIANTPDFANYAADIDRWLDTHDVTDIQVAYYAVKGELAARGAPMQDAYAMAEANKEMALNAGGNSGNATYIRDDQNLVDSLIASKSNPNIF